MKRILAFLACAAAATVALLVTSHESHGQGQGGPSGDITAVRTGSASGLSGGVERGVADLTLAMTALTCTGTDKISAVTATGVFTCTADTDSGGDVTAITTTAPLGVGGTPGATCSSGSCALSERAYGGTTTTGYVPTGGSSTTFLRGDGTWVTPTDTNTLGPDGDKGDITVGGTGTTLTIDASTVTSAKLNITTTSCSAGQHVSAISAGGVGTCTADAGGISGLTTNTFPIATSATTIGNSVITDDTSVITITGRSLVVGSGLDVNGVYSGFGSTDYAYYIDATDTRPGTACLYGTNATGTCYINSVGYQAGTTQTRSLVIADGTGSAAGDTIATFFGTDRSAEFELSVTLCDSCVDKTQFLSSQTIIGYGDTSGGSIAIGTTGGGGNTITIGNATAGDLTVNSPTFITTATTTLNGTANTVGNADTDYLNSRATLAVSGADASVSSGSCTVAGEAQSYRVTFTAEATTCVINLNRTFNSAPYCVFSASDATAATGISAARIYKSAQSTTQSTFVNGTGDSGADLDVVCVDRR